MKKFVVGIVAGWVAVVAAVGCSSSKSKSSRGDSLDLPGDRYFPESMSSDAAGNLYVGSLGTGMVVKFTKTSSTPTTFVAPSGRNFAGVYADDQTSTLWVCSDDATFATNSKVEEYDLASGALKASHPLPAFGFCNDFAFDGSHNLYATDSFGKVLKLAAGAADGVALVVFSTDASLAPSSASGFGADGIVFDGGNLYVNTFSDSRLVKIPITASGTAGQAALMTVTPALQFPDGMRGEATAGSMLVAEAIGTLGRIVVTGTTATLTPLETGLNGPSALTKTTDGVWVAEGQIAAFVSTSSSPTLPFQLKRFPGDI